MNRVSFFLIYAAGIIVIWVGGNPRLRASFLLHPTHLGDALSIGFVVSLLASVVLIRIAAMRGRSIARPRLFWLPLIALLFFPLVDLCYSAAQLLNGWFIGTMSWRLPPTPALLRRAIAIFLGMLPVYSPFLFHLACCAIGTSAKASPGSRCVPGE